MPHGPPPNFNPRTHMGCDVKRCLIMLYSAQISIHAPTWGATPRYLALGRDHQYFNPRTHMGCDNCRRRNNLQRRDFNPRTHMGCDPDRRVDINYAPAISIHAPTWGATPYLNLSYRLIVFQSTHPHGVRPMRLVRRLAFRLIFQSTHPHGVRRCIT